MSMDRSQRLGEGNIPRLLLAFSIPAIVGLLAQALYYVVDRIFIGWALVQWNCRHYGLLSLSC